MKQNAYWMNQLALKRLCWILIRHSDNEFDCHMSADVKQNGDGIVWITTNAITPNGKAIGVIALT